jgi:integrase/recombinase XerD
MLMNDIERYIALRRSLGAGLVRAKQHLTSFADFATDKGERHIRAQTAIAWAAMAPTPATRHRRLSDVVLAARFLRAEDAAHEVPPAGLFTPSKTKLIPYIYTPDELAQILDAAREMQRHEPSPMRRQVYVMLFGLIAATGLRISEALHLRLSDVWPGGILHIRQTKFGKSRLVPLHPTVQQALDAYLVLRRDVVGPDDHLFLTARGRGITYPSVNPAFRNILRLANVAPGRARRPRIHDLRHSFATRVLEQDGAGRETVARRAVALMTYMGHVNPRYTYWYLQATPILMNEVATLAEAWVEGDGR